MAKSGVLRIKIVGDDGPLSKTLSGAGGKLGKFAGIAAKAGAAAAAGFGVLAVKSFADFDSAMTQSLAIMGDVSDSMRKDMSDAAREVAKTTTFSAAQAAESYFFLASAGMDAEQSIAALPQVAAFAQAGMFDMATATDLATDAQSALGLASDDAQENLKNLTRVTDVFVKANTLANTSVEQVAEAMTNKAGAAMRAVGMDIEEGTAVLAAFADQGTKGAEAGTQFSIVMRDLQSKALENADAFEEAGVAVFDSSGEFRNMADIIGDLEGRLDGMSDAQLKAELAALGFTDKSIAALQALLGTSDAIREYERELRNAAGTTEEVAGKQLETFNAQIGLLKDRFMDLAISAGSVIVPKLLAAIEKIEPVMKAFGAGFTGNVNAAADSMRDGQEGAVLFGRKMRDVFDAVSTWVRTFITEQVIPRIIRFKDAVVENGDRIGRIFDNLGRIVAAVAGIFGTQWQSMADSAEGSSGTIEDVVDAIVGFLEGFSDVVADVIEFFERNWPTIAEVINTVSDMLRGDLSTIEATFNKVFTGISNFAARKMAEVANSIIDRINEVLAKISAIPIPGFGSVSVGGAQISRVSMPTPQPTGESTFSSEGPGGRFHSGGMVTSALPRAPGGRLDEKDIRVQTGERILSRREVAAGAGGGTPTIHLTVNAPNYMGDKRELGRVVAEVLREHQRRGGTLGFSAA